MVDDMKFRIQLLLIGLVLFQNIIGFGQNKSAYNLSDSAQISLLTCSAGEELYSIFGHSAIRVKDPSINLDLVFNYGTFDFSDPNFYPNFVKGHLNYILSVSRYINFEMAYSYENRSIYEQKLNLNTQEKQFLLDSLIVNYKPENRYYLYDFFYDNCATRIRNIFMEAIPREIAFDYSSFEKNKSFRELLMPNLEYMPWAKLGINLLLGLPADKKASPWEYQFLPEHLDKAFQHAYFKNGPDSIPFAQKPQLILGREEPKHSFCWWAPQYLFILLLLVTIAISYFDFRNGIKNFWFDRILFISAGLLGALFTFLWVGTAHRAMVWNFNLLWANPFHILLILFISSKRLKKWVKLYLKANLFILLVLLITWPFLPQTLPIVVYPCVLALSLRMFMYSRYY